MTINTGEKPPREEELTSVAEWNRRHGRNFIILGCAMFLTLSVFAYVMEKLDGGVLPAAILLLALFAEIGWVMQEQRVMKKTLKKKRFRMIRKHFGVYNGSNLESVCWK